MRRALASLLLLAACAPPAEVDSQRCGTCHAKQLAEWSTSSHAASGAKESFLAMLPKVEQALGSVARARCETCHSPGPADPHGIGCASCHLAIGNRGTGNGALVVDPDGPIATSREVAAPHATRSTGFLVSSELCGTCHEVHGPGLLDEPTLTEFAQTAPPAGVTCLTCHVKDHRMRGLSAESLAEALSLTWDEHTVTLQNVGARHRVPTGMAALRDVWVDVQLGEADGGTHLEARVFELGAELIGPSGSFIDATEIHPRGLQFGEARTWSTPSTVLRADLHFTRLRSSAPP